MNNQQERLDYLLQYMQQEMEEYQSVEIPDEYEDRKKTLRGFMNMRMPKPVPEEIYQVQDLFLQEEAEEKGIIEWKRIPTVKRKYGSIHPFANKLSVWKGDITRLKVGAIVNAANSQLLGCFIPCHNCVDNAIHSASGMQLREECYSIMQKKRMEFGKDYEEPVGSAILTKGYNLPAEYIIHTVGPVVDSKLNSELCGQLQDCYESVLKCAIDNEIRTVALCCISTGEFCFPNEVAANIAVETVSEFLEKHNDKFDRIIFNVFKRRDLELYKNRLN